MADDDNFIDTSVDPADCYGSDHGGYSPSRAPQAEEGEDDELNDLFKRLQKLKARKKKMSSVGDVMKRSEKVKKVEGSGNEGLSKRSRVMSSRVRRSVRLKGKGKVMDDDDVEEEEEEEEEMTLAEMKKFGKNDADNDEGGGDMMTLAEMKKLGKNDVDNDKEGEGDTMTLAEMKKLSKTNVSDDDDDDGGGDDGGGDYEVMTLAEMQKVVKKNVNDVNLKVRFKVNKKDKVPKSGSRSRKTKDKTIEETEIHDVSDDDDDGGGDDEVMTLVEMQKVVKKNVNDDNLKLRFKVNEKDKVPKSGSRSRKTKDKTIEETEIHDVSDDDDDGGGDDGGGDDEVMTLAEMQKVVKKNVNDVNLKVRFKVNEKDKVPKSGSRSRKTKDKTIEETEIHDVDKVPKSGLRSRKSKNKTSEETENQDVDIMSVEDSDFYDFDKLRVEQSFKKGQIWALYDDDDGMPRHYGLINEVVSRYPFQVDMFWLDPQINTDEELLSLERTGFHISCGRFKVASKTLVESLNVFSHNVDCERAAKEVYRIYPKKGSVWALYSENRERENELVGDRRRYDIVVFLTSYSEVHGLSMGYLEKINGFKTIFRRREIGCHAIKWLEKHEVRLFSHQIPARKLSREEVPDISGDCWELDPASLPTLVATL